MHEYLIRADGDDALLPNKDSLQALGVTAGQGWHECEGLGDFRIGRGDVELSFSCEEVGLQIAVEGATGREEADAIIERMSLRLTQSEGRQTHVVPLN